MARKLVALLLGLSLLRVGSAEAEDLISCVSPDVALTLLGNPGEFGRPNVTREIPKRFPLVKPPSDFELIGSRTAGYFNLVSYRSLLSPDTAKTSLESTMAAAQWQQPDPDTQSFSPRGFQATPTNSIRAAATFCRDDYGQIIAWF